MIKRGDVAGDCDAGSPGSGGASPYPELRPICDGPSTGMSPEALPGTGSNIQTAVPLDRQNWRLRGI
jgi:hypothetical protein